MVGCLLLVMLVVVLIAVAIAGIVANLTAKSARRASHSAPGVAPSPAARRTTVYRTSQGDLTAGSLSSSQLAYLVPVESEGDAYSNLVVTSVNNRPSRVMTVFLRPDLEDPGGLSRVVVQTDLAVRLGRLPSAEASHYRPLLVALAERGMIGSARGKVFGGTGDRERLTLKIDLDSPRRVAADFGINALRDATETR
jgi:hypothetical protein